MTTVVPGHVLYYEAMTWLNGPIRHSVWFAAVRCQWTMVVGGI